MNTKKLKGILIGDYEVPGTVDNLWIDTSNPKKVATKVFVDGEWKTSGGGASADDITPGNLITVDADGKLVDANKSTSDFVETPETAGTSGQLLSTNAQGETEWINPNYVEAPSTAGTEGQILKMGSDGPVWGNAPAGSVMDDAMSDISENPVQNKVIKSYVDGKVTQTTGDSTEAVMSQKAVTDTFEDYVKQGSYSQSTRVGLADNLVSPIDVKDAFLFRPTATELGVSSDNTNEVSNGLSYLNGIEGNAVAWNQVIKNGNFAEMPGLSDGWKNINSQYVDNTNPNYIRYTGLSWPYYLDQPLIVGHKYYIYTKFRWADTTASGSRPYIYFASFDSGSTHSVPIDGSWDEFKAIRIAEGNGQQSSYGIIRLVNASNGGIDISKTPGIIIIDLTLACPELAADANLTPAMVEKWLAKNVGSKPYYAYNAGTLLGAQYKGLKALKTPNLLNPTTKTARLFEYTYGNATNKYTISNLPTGSTLYFTPDNTGVEAAVTMDDATHFTVASQGTLRVDTNDSVTETWLVAYWDGGMDSYDNYKPYQENSNVIDTRYIYYDNGGIKTKVWADGVMKATGSSDIDVKDSLYVDGNDGKWKADINVGDVDLGTGTWTKRNKLGTSGPDYFFSGTFSQVSGNIGSKLLCTKYLKGSLSHIYYVVYDKIISFGESSNIVCFTDNSYSEAPTSSDNWLNGVHLWYELATPIHHDTLYYSEDGENFTEMTINNYPNGIIVNNWAYEEANVSPYDNGNPTSVAPVIEMEYQEDIVEEIDTMKHEKIDVEDLRGSMQNLVTTINTNCSTVLGGTLSIASETDASGHLQFEFTATE